MTWNGWKISNTALVLARLHDELGVQHGLARDNFIKQHCEIVARISLAIAEKSGVVQSPDERELLTCGALAHDIGTYAVLNDENFATRTEPIFQRGIYIRHGVLGYELLLSKGLPEELALFARNHTGVGLTKEDCIAQNLPLEPADYQAQTPLQEIVMLADKFHTKSLPPKFVSAETARKRCEKFGDENLRHWNKLVADYYGLSDQELTALADEYAMALM